MAVGDCSPETVELFKGFVRYDSGKRLKADKALGHDYFVVEPPPPAAAPDAMPIPKPKAATANQLDFRVNLTMKELLADLSDVT